MNIEDQINDLYELHTKNRECIEANKKKIWINGILQAFLMCIVVYTVYQMGEMIGILETILRAMPMIQSLGGF